jgi:hypothetical protein
MARKRPGRAAAPVETKSHESDPAAVRRAWRARPGSRTYRRIARAVRRQPAAFAVGLALLHIVMALLSFQPQPHTGGDNGAYITLGQSLLERGTYTELWDPAQPPHTKYPPVFPAVLAVAMALGLTPWVPLKLVVLGFSAAAIAFTFLWLRARRRAAFGLGIGVMLALSPGVLREGRWILSDVPFWAFTMIALWAFERLRPGDWRRFGVGAVAVLLAYFTRSAGLPLVLAALAWLGLRRRWQHAAALAALVGLPALLWWLRGRALGPSAYISEFWYVDPYLPMLGTIGFADLLSRMGANTFKYATIHLPVLLAGDVSTLAVPVGILIFALAFLAWFGRARRPRVSDLFVFFYLGLILVWPAIWSGERFLLPLLPLLLLLAAEALLGAARLVAPRQDLRAAAAAAALIVFVALPGLSSAVGTGLECTGRYLEGEEFPCLGSEYHEDFFAFSAATAEALPGDAVVLNRKPRLFYVLSGGIRSAIYPLNEDPASFFAAAEEAGARYVLYDELDGVSDLYLRPVIAFYARGFCVMWAAERTGTTLFGILPDAGSVEPLGIEEVRAGYISFPFCGDAYWRSPEARLLHQRG